MQRKKRKSLSIKGLPSVAADSADERHAGIRHTDAAELSFTNDGRITETVRNAFQQVCGDLGAGVFGEDSISGSTGTHAKSRRGPERTTPAAIGENGSLAG